MLNLARVFNVTEAQVQTMRDEFEFHAGEEFAYRWNLIVNAVEDVLATGEFDPEKMKMLDIFIGFGVDGMYFHLGELTVNLEVNAKVDDTDIVFSVWHEFGHVLDWVHGVLWCEETEEAIFMCFNGWRKTTYDIMLENNREDYTDGERHVKYATMPHELSANVYAYLNCGTKPADEMLAISYELAKTVVDG